MDSRISKNEDTNKYLLILFLMNFVFQIFRYSFSEIRYTHIILLVFQLIFILLFLFFSEKNKKNSKIVMILIFIFFVQIFVTPVIRYILGFNFKNSILSLNTDLISAFIIIIYYYMIVRIPIDKRDIESLLMFYLYASLFFIAYSLIFQFGEILIAITGNNAYASNVSSFFINRNGFGNYLFIFYTIYVIQNEFYKNKIGKIKYSLVYAITGLFIVLTLSRTSIMGTIIFTMLFFMNSTYEKIKENKYKIKNVLIGQALLFIIIGLIVYLLNNKQVVNFILEKIIRSKYSTSGRINIWKIGIDHWKQSKIFGMGSFQARGTMEFGTFHNTILEILVRNGILGLVLKLMIIASFITAHCRLNIRTREERINFSIYIFSIFLTMQFESRLLFKIGFQAIIIIFASVLFTQKTSVKNEEYNKMDKT